MNFLIHIEISFSQASGEPRIVTTIAGIWLNSSLIHGKNDKRRPDLLLNVPSLARSTTRLWMFQRFFIQIREAYTIIIPQFTHKIVSVGYNLQSYRLNCNSAIRGSPDAYDIIFKDIGLVTTLQYEVCRCTLWTRWIWFQRIQLILSIWIRKPYTLHTIKAHFVVRKKHSINTKW
jgi:hypothetical protein